MINNSLTKGHHYKFISIINKTLSININSWALKKLFELNDLALVNLLKFC